MNEETAAFLGLNNLLKERLIYLNEQVEKTEELVSRLGLLDPRDKKGSDLPEGNKPTEPTHLEKYGKLISRLDEISVNLDYVLSNLTKMV